MNNKKNHAKVVGWVFPYDTRFKNSELTEDKKLAIINKIRKKKYYYSWSDSQFMDGCTPMFNDYTYCNLTKPQYDEIFSEALKDYDDINRLLPIDATHTTVCDSVVWEKTKYMEEYKNNGTN